MARRLEALEKRLGTLAAAETTLKDLRTNQATLAEQTKALSEQLARLTEADRSGLAEARATAARLAKLEETLTSLAAAAEKEGAGALPQIAALSGKVNDLSTALETKLQALEKKLDREIGARVAAVDSRLEASRIAQAKASESLATVLAGSKRLGLEIETARTELKGLAKRLEALKAAAATRDASLEDLEGRLGALERSFAAFRKGLEARLAQLPDSGTLSASLTPLKSQLKAIETRLASVLASEKRRRQSTSQIILALELSSLKRAIERGEPIADLLTRLKRHAPDDLDLSPLEKEAARGVATTGELQRAFRDVVRAVLDAAAQPEGGSVLDQIVAGARSIVRIRRTGNIAGETPEAILARAEARLAEDDLEGAYSEMRKLKGRPRAAAAAWLARLEARLAVNRALARIDERLKTAVAGEQAPAE